MYECYDCGESFSFYGDCPSCGSENVSATNDNGSKNVSDDDYEDDVFEDEDEISEALLDANYDEEEKDD